MIFSFTLECIGVSAESAGGDEIHKSDFPPELLSRGFTPLQMHSFTLLFGDETTFHHRSSLSLLLFIRSSPKAWFGLPV